VADRLLLESSAVDGYLLEDGTGVLLLDTSVAYVVGTTYEFSRNATAVTTVDAPNFTAVAGETLIATVSSTGSGTPTRALSDTVGTNDTWTLLRATATGTTHIAFYMLQNCAAGSCTIRCTWSSGTQDYPGIAITRVTGLHASAFDDAGVHQVQTSPGTGTDAITSGNTGTLSSQPRMVLGVSYSYTGTATPSTGTGYTNIGAIWNFEGAFGLCARLEHKRVTATTAVATTFTTTQGSDTHLTMAVTLKESVGGGPDLTLALTGIAITGSQGAEVPARELAATGQALTSGQGTLTAAKSEALTGTALASGQESVTPSRDKAATGQSGTFGQGSVAPVTALAGSAATTGQGSTTPTSARALTGSAASFTSGTSSPSATLALTGQALTSGQGTVTPSSSTDVALTGTAATTGQGSVVPSRTVAGSGQAGTFGQGTLTPMGDESDALTGQALAGSQGSLTPSQAPALTGSVLTGTQGTGVPSTTLALAGQALTSGQGSVTTGADATAALTGQAITSPQGTATPSITLGLTGQALTANTGTVTVASSDVTVALSGQVLTTSTGTVTTSNAASATLTGIALAGSTGTLIGGTQPFETDNTFIQSASGIVVASGSQEAPPEEQTPENTFIQATTGTLVASGGRPVERRNEAGGRRRRQVKEKGDKKHFTLKIDDHLFIVHSKAEATELYEEALRMARVQAKEQADAVVTSRKNRAATDKKPISIDPVTLEMPKVAPEEDAESMDFASVLKAELRAIYQRAASDAELAIATAQQRALDEEEALVLLLLD